MQPADLSPVLHGQHPFIPLGSISRESLAGGQTSGVDTGLAFRRRRHKWEVWEAYRQVKANQGAPGVDGVTLEQFDADLKNQLYRIWNRMSSGSYFPPAVKAVQIPKSHGGGTRTLGVPTVADRIAQTVVARRLEAKVEPIFHPDSYGYRPNRSALHAVAACRQRCWSHDWVIDLDVESFFDSVRWDLLLKAVAVHCTDPWV